MEQSTAYSLGGRRVKTTIPTLAHAFVCPEAYATDIRAPRGIKSHVTRPSAPNTGVIVADDIRIDVLGDARTTRGILKATPFFFATIMNTPPTMSYAPANDER